MRKQLKRVTSLVDLATRARTDPRYERLAMLGASNLGGSARTLDEALRWLRTNAQETDEQGVIDEVNFMRDIEAELAKRPAK